MLQAPVTVVDLDLEPYLAGWCNVLASLTRTTPLSFVSLSAIKRLHCLTMNDWSTGLFDCCRVPEGIYGADAGYVFCKAFCGCCSTATVYGENVLMLDGHANGRGWAGPCFDYFWRNWIPCGWQALLAGPTRRRIRELHGLKEEPCSDYCVHLWCSPCAVCQEARELKIKGTPLSGYGKGIELKPGSAIPVSTIPGSSVATPPPTQLMTEPSSQAAAGKEAASGIHTIPVAAVPRTAPGNKSVRFSLEAVTAEIRPSAK